MILRIQFLIASLLFCVNCNSQFTDLHHFDILPDAANPQLGDFCSDGEFLFGMTYIGGENNGGTIFKIKHDGSAYEVIYSFTSATGIEPWGTLLLHDSKLYGITRAGGSNHSGVVFKIDTDGANYTVLHDFNSPTDGRNSVGSLLLENNKLIGMTQLGGANDHGTIFKLDIDGTNYTVLHDFDGADGKEPNGRLYSDENYYYGTTRLGGTNDQGVVFRVNHNGDNYTILHSFNGFATGRDPYSTLVSDGNFLYGTTRFGGNNDVGTVFKLTKDGSGFQKLIDCSNANGREPHCGLVLTNGVLYGTNYQGGSNSLGNVFSLNTDGTGYTILHNFVSNQGGKRPTGGLYKECEFLYGMTNTGGDEDKGTIFKYQYRNIQESIDNQFTCSDFTWIDGNTYFENNSTATYMYQDQDGCDSLLVTLDLTITSINKAVYTQENSQLMTALQDSATYQWLDCENDYQIILGETSQSLVPPIFSHNFAVEITLNGCVDTSFCTQSFLNIETLGDLETEISIFPNPSNGLFTISIHSELIEEINYSVTNLEGRTLITKERLNTNTFELIDLSSHAVGVYFLTLYHSDDLVVYKLIKR